MTAAPRYAAIATAIATWLGACAQPECVNPSYRRAECRVIAENELARMRSSEGVEIRFQDPRALDDGSWDARGLLRERTGEGIAARVAGAGAFALSVRRGPTGPDRVRVRLDNVDPAAIVTVHAPDGEVEIPPTDPPSTSRVVDVPLPDDDVRWIRGDRPCPARYRLAITADIQTNPTQFERIVDRMHREISDAAAAGTPVMALLIAGDISESTRDEEFEIVADILARVPVPVAVTAGNHDIYVRSRPNYNYAFGPGNHAFRVCDTKIVMLDTGSGSIASSVHARLPELLDREGARHLLVGMHHPVYPGVTAAGWSQEDQAAAVLVELAIARTDLIFAGHLHALHDFSGIPVGDTRLREIIVGTAGALQGFAAPRYGYVRLTIDPDGIEPCFVEVPPPGYDGPVGDPLPDLPYCDD